MTTKVKGRQLVGSQEIMGDDEVTHEDVESSPERPVDDQVAMRIRADQSPVDSTAERARASALSIDTSKQPDEAAIIGDQRVI